MNGSTVVTNADVESAMAALAIQIYRDFEPAGYPAANLRVRGQVQGGTRIHPDPGRYPPGRCPGVPHSGLRTAQPIGVVFARTAMQAGATWTSVLSHEVLEQLADPWINMAAVGTWQGKPCAIAWETCDAVEGIGYKIRDVEVSNFVLPRWFARKWRPQPATISWVSSPNPALCFRAATLA